MCSYARKNNDFRGDLPIHPLHPPETMQEGTNTPGRWGSEEARQEESNSKKWLAADTEWPSHSTHYCVGKDYTTRTCLFTNIVYNKDINEWYYYPANPPANNMCASV